MKDYQMKNGTSGGGDGVRDALGEEACQSLCPSKQKLQRMDGRIDPCKAHG